MSVFEFIGKKSVKTEGFGYFMEQSTEFKQQLMQEYKQNVMPLLKYLPWLEQNSGRNVSTVYDGQSISEHSISFPVYDGTLMNFVREASKSPLMDKNYKYVYTRNHIDGYEAERQMIQKAGWREWDILRGILSRYVLEGRIKGTLWSEGVRENIFCLVLKQMREIIEYWDKPLNLN